MVTNLPKNFYTRHTVNGIDTNLSEQLVLDILKSYFACEDIMRGNPNNREPDYRLVNEWVEITNIETKAQRDLKHNNWFREERNGTDIIILIDNALEKKSNKKYSVAKCSVALLCIDYAPFLFDKCKNSLYEPYIQKYVDDFYDKLYNNYLKVGVFGNIYILCINTNNRFTIIDILKHYERKEYINNVEFNDENYAHPYLSDQ